MEKLVTVIIPIYNVEQYLERCIDSVVKQTYKNLQILLIDDGSPDRCGEICDRYAQKDDRIEVLHKPNGGLSDARNSGLDLRKGEYVFFVDSDDWIAEDAIELLLKCFADYEVDIVAGSSVDVCENNGEYTYLKYSVPLGSKSVLNTYEAMKDNLLYGWAAWNKLYKSSLFDNIRFPIGIINEDEAILTFILEQCTSIIKIGVPTYFYYLRENSITSSAFSERKMDWYNNCRRNFDYISEKHQELIQEAAYRLISSILYLLHHFLKNKSRYHSQLKILQEDLNHHCKFYMRNKYLRFRGKIKLIAYLGFLKLIDFSYYK